MKKHLSIFSICCLLTSCASIINRENLEVYLYTKKPAQILYKSDTIHTKEFEKLNAATLTVPRSKDPLQFELLSDSLSRKVSIPSRISLLYYMNVVYPLLWPGLLIDLSSSDRYTYKNVLAFDDTLSLSMVSKAHIKAIEKQKADIIIKHNNIYGKTGRDKFYSEKGDVYFSFAVPFIYPGHTVIKPNRSSYKGEVSVLGFAGGFDYYYKKNRFVNLSASATSGGDIVIGCGFDGYDDSERFNIYNVTLSHNHRYKRFSFGYGLSHSYVHWWEDKYFDSPFTQSDHSNDSNDFYHMPAYNRNENMYSNLGFVFNGYYYLSNGFSVGLVYKPTLIRLSSIMDKRICYEHQISLDFAFKIRLSKRK